MSCDERPFVAVALLSRVVGRLRTAARKARRGPNFVSLLFRVQQESYARRLVPKWGVLSRDVGEKPPFYFSTAAGVGAGATSASAPLARAWSRQRWPSASCFAAEPLRTAGSLRAAARSVARAVARAAAATAMSECARPPIGARADLSSARYA